MSSDNSGTLTSSPMPAGFVTFKVGDDEWRAFSLHDNDDESYYHEDDYDNYEHYSLVCQNICDSFSIGKLICLLYDSDYDHGDVNYDNRLDFDDDDYDDN